MLPVSELENIVSLRKYPWMQLSPSLGTKVKISTSFLGH